MATSRTLAGLPRRMRTVEAAFYLSKVEADRICKNTGEIVRLELNARRVGNVLRLADYAARRWFSLLAREVTDVNRSKSRGAERRASAIPLIIFRTMMKMITASENAANK